MKPEEMAEILERLGWKVAPPDEQRAMNANRDWLLAFGWRYTCEGWVKPGDAA